MHTYIYFVKQFVFEPYLHYRRKTATRKSTNFVELYVF